MVLRHFINLLPRQPIAQIPVGRRGQQADEMPQHHFKKRLTVFLTTFKCRFFTSQPSPLKKLWLHSSLNNFHIFSEIQITNCKTEN
jgi:hypothetical protein